MPRECRRSALEELLTYAMEHMGWNPSEYRVFGCRVDDPVQVPRVMMEWAPDPASR